MKSLRQLILIPALLILMLGSAAAQRHEGYYLGAYFGLPVTDSLEAKDDLGSFNLKLDAGQVYAVTIGYDLPIEGVLGNGRIELEYNQRSHDFATADFRTGNVPATGTLQVQQLMLNSLATFSEVGFFALTPYVGVGIGAAQVKVDKLTVIGQPLLDDESLVFSAQAGCGLQKDLTAWLRLDLGYRFSYITDPELSEIDGRKVKLTLNSHQGMLGLVFLFKAKLGNKLLPLRH